MSSRAFLVLCLAASAVGASSATAAGAGQSAYWRFESCKVEQSSLVSTLDDGGARTAVAGGRAPAISQDVPMAVVPLTTRENHASISFDGGYLRVTRDSELDITRNFTVEMWAKFSSPCAPTGDVLISKGDPTTGNWHIIRRPDGDLCACVYGGPVAHFLDSGSGGPIPNVWYHLAATYEDIGDGRIRIRAYLNGNLRDTATGALLKDTSGSDLFVGSFTDGKFPFHGLLDEPRITPLVLRPADLLIAGQKEIPQSPEARGPVFVRPGTRIDAKLREQALGAPVLLKPDGYRYFYKYTTGTPLLTGSPSGAYDTGFDCALQGWAVVGGGSAAGYSFAVKPRANYVVALGFYDPVTPSGKRLQRVVIDGKLVDTLDTSVVAHHKPIVRLYDITDANGDGFLQVSCSHINDELGFPGMMNVIWIFSSLKSSEIDANKLLAGTCELPPIYYVACGRGKEMKGHVSYPDLSAPAKSAIQPMRPVPFDLYPNHPQPADPLDVTVRGELSDRINTYLDRWAYAGRDQGLVPGFLSDCGYEVVGRNIETLYMLSRLTQKDFDLKPPFEALLARQDAASKHPGAFVGGSPLRTGFIWGQGTVLSGLMGYHELTGDARALEAAGKLSDWYQSYLDNGDLAAANYFAADGKFSRDGATVGHLGKGALEPLVWLYWRTKDPKHLKQARQIAELNREWGGVAWMINGDLPPERQQYEGWHIHANLTTVRGFPWLYAATGDRSYLDDAIASCDRVFERATWSTGGVLEQIPWVGTTFAGANPDPHDETCQTADELQLSYLLADFTGEGRFYDRAEQIYYNHIRYMQMHNGDFSAFNRLPGPQRGGDAWFCCGWWGAKALYEVARHLYASSPSAIYVNGYAPSSVNLTVGGTTVKVDASADIPKSGEVHLTVSPKATARFDLKLRVPSWAEFRSVSVNGREAAAESRNGYVTLRREWKPRDTVDVEFGLPLRVVLDSSWDTLPAAKVSVDGAATVESRCVSIFQGPVILAQFRLAHGCDLNWVYTGDHPDLLDTLNSSTDIIDAGEWQFESSAAPVLTSVTQTRAGIKLEWSFEPRPGWTLKRTALVRAGVPVKVEYSAELTAPSAEALKSVKSAMMCGVRMKTSGFVDYRPAKLTVNGRATRFSDVADSSLPSGSFMLDNGYVRFGLNTAKSRAIALDSGNYAAIYAVPEARGNTLAASCELSFTHY